MLVPTYGFLFIPSKVRLVYIPKKNVQIYQLIKIIALAVSVVSRYFYHLLGVILKQYIELVRRRRIIFQRIFIDLQTLVIDNRSVNCGGRITISIVLS